jgi:hypothetical protein
MAKTISLSVKVEQLGYVRALIRELPSLNTVDAKRRSLRAIFQALTHMYPQETKGFKFNDIRIINHTINVEEDIERYVIVLDVKES